jgi:hypothetical protein
LLLCSRTHDIAASALNALCERTTGQGRINALEMLVAVVRNVVRNPAAPEYRRLDVNKLRNRLPSGVDAFLECVATLGFKADGSQVLPAF